MSGQKLLGLGAAIVFLASLFSSTAHAELIYRIDPCSFQGGCQVTETQHGTGSSPGPTNADFVSFYSSIFPESITGPDPQFDWFITGISADGTVIGEVLGGNDVVSAFDTQFVFEGGSITCCTIDEPYRFFDINNNDLIVGGSPDEGSSGLLSPAFLAQGGCGGEACEIPFNLTPTAAAYFSSSYPFGLPSDFAFVAIDNRNRILTSTGIQLDPLPEPLTLSIFGAGLIGASVIRSRRVEKKTPTRTSECSAS
jgi:hypothetical protein